MRDNEYWAEQSRHVGRQTIRCPVCGSPWCDDPTHGAGFIIA